MELESQSTAFFSIKPKFVTLISSGDKNYEFRKYIPSKQINHIIVYTTHPVGEIKYILSIETIVEYPDKIDENGEGNIDFNEGKKKSTYAYKIGSVYQLDKGIPLSYLRQRFRFSPPQRFIYGDSQLELLRFIESFPKRRII